MCTAAAAVAGGGGSSMRCSTKFGARPASFNSFIWVCMSDGSTVDGSKRSRFGAKTSCSLFTHGNTTTTQRQQHYHQLSLGHTARQHDAVASSTIKLRAPQRVRYQDGLIVNHCVTRTARFGAPIDVTSSCPVSSFRYPQR
jgi:hypothetical protein